MGMQRSLTLRRLGAFAVAAAAALMGTAAEVTAQTLKDVKMPDKPLVLKAQGSFFVGGEKVEVTQAQVGDLAPGGHITVNQMYVRYMIPQGSDRNVPVVMIHGATLTGKSWETTPDGRMGWDEYFVRKGRSVYVPDQVGRGRSGFNQVIFNDVRAGATPPANQPVWLRFSDESVWPNFRFGASAGQPFPDSQFPVTALDELAKQGVPDMFRGTTAPSTIRALSNLALQWCQPMMVFNETRRVLRPGGLFVFTTFGPDTLRELRSAWSDVDGQPHVHSFLDLRDVGDLLLAAGFRDPVVDVERVVLHRRSVREVLRELKLIGAHNVAQGRSRGLTGKAHFTRFQQAYEALATPQGIPVTYEVVYGHAWAPTEMRARELPQEAIIPLSSIRRRG